MTDPKIDIYNHVMPPAYVELVKQHGKEPGMVKRMSNLRMLWDMPARVEMLKGFPGVQQVISLAVPSPEMLGGPDVSPGYARVANEGMAEICRQWPETFPYFVASLPMNNPEAALQEMDYAIEKLGAKGVQVLTSVNGKALDEPEVFKAFSKPALSRICAVCGIRGTLKCGTCLKTYYCGKQCQTLAYPVHRRLHH